MKKNDTQVIPVIDGYSEEQVLFTLDEISKKTDHITLQIYLYRKFGLHDYQADDLIQKVKQKTGLSPTVYVASTEDDMVQILVQKGYNRDEAEAKVREHLSSHNEKSSSVNTSNVVIGILILGVGLLITFSGAGVIAYGAIIVGAIRIFSGLFSNDD